eukprot:4141394-Pyramimonas_sp.AAC.1
MGMTLSTEGCLEKLLLKSTAKDSPHGRCIGMNSGSPWHWFCITLALLWHCAGEFEWLSPQKDSY